MYLEVRTMLCHECSDNELEKLNGFCLYPSRPWDEESQCYSCLRYESDGFEWRWSGKASQLHARKECV